MLLKGNLNSFDLTTIFQLLESEKKTGLLKIDGDEKTVRVFVKDGQVAYASDGQADTRLGNILINRKVISHEQLKACLRLGNEKRRGLANILVESGIITPETLQAFIQEQTENIVFDLFFCKRADFEYRDVGLNASHIPLVQLNTMQILLEASRRVDEMEELKKLIPGDDTIFRKIEEIKGSADALTDRELIILSLINGRYSIRELIGQSGDDKYSVYKTLAGLIDSGFIERCDNIKPQKHPEDVNGRLDDQQEKKSLDEPDDMRLRLLLSSLGRSGLIKTTGAMAPSSASSYDARFYNSLVGRQLDNYAVMAFIGSGGIGGVFHCRDMTLNREVAMKVISSELAAQKTFRDQFIKKARMISSLEHPNIAHIYHVGNKDDILYYTMEFIDGDTLAGLIKKSRTINISKGIDYLISACSALDFASRKNISPGDINPHNIMVDKKGDLKIVDFGITKTIDTNNLSNLQEAAMYISPECMDRHSLDHRSDIYSLGAIFYHAFTSHPPFEGDGIREILNQHRNSPLTPLNEKNPDIPDALGKIIEKMLAKAPGDRYQDFKSIIDTIKALRTRK